MSPRLGLASLLLAAAVHHAAAAPAPAAAAPTSPTTGTSAAIQSCMASMNGALPSPTPGNFVFSGNVRRYYVAAEQVSWDYAPTGWDNWLGVPLNESPRAQAAGYLTNGTVWEKAQYIGYTDSSFTTLTEQPATLGMNGPILRSEVGDMVEILFVNRLSVNWASMHSMGLAYTKNDEGSDYANNTAPGQASIPAPGDAVAPGDCVVYKWMVSQGAAPPTGQASQMWGYHSFVTFQEGQNAGLTGAQIVYQPGKMQSTMASHREFVLLFMVFDENLSFMSSINAAAKGVSTLSSREAQGPGPQGPPSMGGQGMGGGPGHQSHGPPGPSHTSARGPSGTSTTASAPIASTSNGASLAGGYTNGNSSIYTPQLIDLATSNQFPGAPKFYSLNGWVFSNNVDFEMCLNDQVIWYVYGQGSASHVFHMHGNGFQEGGNPGVNRAVISLNDGDMFTLDMTASGAGKWQVICHVDNHDSYGMEADYYIYQNNCPLAPLPT